jgi:hypothetical protein
MLYFKIIFCRYLFWQEEFISKPFQNIGVLEEVIIININGGYNLQGTL